MPKVTSLTTLTMSGLAVVLATGLMGCGTTREPQGRWHPNGGPPRDENWHSPAATLMRYDANHDGILARAELIDGLKAEFEAADHAHNNCLPPDQVRAINQMRVKRDASQATPLVDWNQDGCIDLREYSGTLLSLFDSLDANGDGKLTAAEINPPKKTQGIRRDEVAPGAHTGRGRGGGDDDGQNQKPGERP